MFTVGGAHMKKEYQEPAVKIVYFEESIKTLTIDESGENHVNFSDLFGNH